MKKIAHPRNRTLVSTVGGYYDTTTPDAEKIAFRTPIENFYYTVMPFGLKNAGATYQRTMTACSTT